MEDVFGRLNLYRLSAGIALRNGALPQADNLLKAAIKLIQEVPNRVGKAFLFVTSLSNQRWI
jgi:hypothetical protein